MKIYIALLRGINVSGHKIIKMNDLRILFESLSFENVKTYIQSGNIIFTSKETANIELEKIIQTAIFTKFGFDVPVFVEEFNTFKARVSKNIFSTIDEEKIKHLHVTFLSDTPTKENIELLNLENTGKDTFIIIDNTIFIQCVEGYSDSLLSNSFFEKKLKLRATTRNWKTVTEIIKIGSSI